MGKPGDEKRVWVGGLPSNVTDKEIRDAFGKFGNIEDVIIRHGSRDTFCFVQYEEERSVGEAKRKLDQSSIFGSFKIKVNYVNKEGEGKGKGKRGDRSRSRRGKGKGKHGDRSRSRGKGRDRSPPPRPRDRSVRRPRDRGDRDDRGGGRKGGYNDDRGPRNRSRGRQNEDRGRRDDYDDRGRRDGGKGRGRDDFDDRGGGGRPPRDRDDRGRRDEHDERGRRDGGKGRGRDNFDDRGGGGRPARDRDDRGRRDEPNERGRRDDGKGRGRDDFNDRGGGGRFAKDARFRERDDRSDDERSVAGEPSDDGGARGRSPKAILTRNTSVGRDRSVSAEPTKSAGNVIVLEGLPDDMQDDELEEVGANYGTVIRSKLWDPPRRGCKHGLLEYEGKAGAAKAIEELNGRRMQGWEMRLKVYLEK